MLKHLLCGTALSLAATAALAGAPDAALQASLQHIADQARPGTLGIMVMDEDAHSSVMVNGGRPYLMMSTFKAPIAAAVLSQVDAGTLRLNLKVHLTPADVLEGSAVPSLGASLKAGPRDVTIDELLHASVTQSDNTAVDALLCLLGGQKAPAHGGCDTRPGSKVVTDFLHAKGLNGMRVDMGEGELAKMFDARGGDAVLASQVDSSTLEAATGFLLKLNDGRLLSAQSSSKLLGLMHDQVIPSRLRAGLPAGYQIADKTGTSGTRKGRMAAFNDIGIITAPNGQKRIVAVFLSQSTATPEQATTWFAEIGKTVAASM